MKFLNMARLGTCSPKAIGIGAIASARFRETRDSLCTQAQAVMRFTPGPNAPLPRSFFPAMAAPTVGTMTHSQALTYPEHPLVPVRDRRRRRSLTAGVLHRWFEFHQFRVTAKAWYITQTCV
jgi:hypothetical protein